MTELTVRASAGPPDTNTPTPPIVKGTARHWFALPWLRTQRSLTIAGAVLRSPAKARTLAHHLGAGHRVLARYGHVVDLPAKAGSVCPDDDFAMVYETAPPWTAPMPWCSRPTRHGRRDFVLLSAEQYDWLRASAQRSHRTDDDTDVVIDAVERAQTDVEYKPLDDQLT